MVSMGNGGIRVFDVRDPVHPTEAAYFNAGMITQPDGTQGLEAAITHPHYDAKTGDIWINTHDGLWVLQLEPQARKALGLPAKSSEYPTGRAARPAGIN
jgi:hypothetical protein